MLLIIISSAFLIADSSQSSCSHLEWTPLASLAQKVTLASSQTQQIDALTALGTYWDRVCKVDREQASSRVVRKLSHLLKIRPARPMLTSLLWDVGPNLKAAQSNIRLAIRDQSIVDRANLNRSVPFMPTNYHVTLDSLSCLDKKIRTGQEDPELCRVLRAVAPGERG